MQDQAPFFKTFWPHLTAFGTSVLFVVRWAVGINGKVKRLKGITMDGDWNPKVVTVDSCKICKAESEKTQIQILAEIKDSREASQKMSQDIATLTGAFKQFVEDQKS